MERQQQNRFQRALRLRWHPSRRCLLRGAIVAGAGVTVAGLAGCRGAEQERSTPEAARTVQPKRGGILRTFGNFDRGFDPHTLPATSASLMGLFYSTLVRFQPRSFDVEPDLAQSWESASPTEFVFRLHPGVKWHNKPPANGRLLQAEDIIFSYERARSDDARFLHRVFLANVERMEAVDRQTLRFILKRPDISTLSSLASFGLKILAPEVVEKAGKFTEAAAVVGTGAFILVKNEPDVGASLVRNPDYFKAGLPYLDGVEIRAFSDAQAAWAAFLAGQLDHRWALGQEAKNLQQERKGQFNFDWFGDQFFMISMANVTRQPFNDRRVTRALRLLYDHDEFKQGWAEVWFGRGRHNSIFPAALETWDLTEEEYTKHLEWRQPKDEAIKEALSLLGAAGFTSDNPLKFTLSGLSSDQSPYQAAAVQLVQAQFRRNSQGRVVPEIKLYDNASWPTVRARGEFEYYTGGHAIDGNDPDFWFSTTYQSNGSRNYGKMSDPHLDQLIEQQRRTFNLQERRKIVREIILYMIDHSPYGSTSAHFVLNAMQPALKGFVPEGSTVRWGHNYENVWLDV